MDHVLLQGFELFSSLPNGNEFFSTNNEQKVRRKTLHAFGSNSFLKVSHRYDGFNLSNKSIKSLTEKVLTAKKRRH